MQVASSCAQCTAALHEQCAADLAFGLCLGCHIVRYCSPECQHEAWFESVESLHIPIPHHFFIPLNDETSFQGWSQEGVQGGPERTCGGCCHALFCGRLICFYHLICQSRFCALPRIARTLAVPRRHIAALSANGKRGAWGLCFFF